jgi:hypothetical protein
MDPVLALVAFLGSIGTIVAFLLGGWAGHARARSEISAANNTAKDAQVVATRASEIAFSATKHIEAILVKIDHIMDDLSRLMQRVNENDVRDRGRYHDINNRLQGFEAQVDLFHHVIEQLCEKAQIAPPPRPYRERETPIRPITTSPPIDPNRRPIRRP